MLKNGVFFSGSRMRKIIDKDCSRTQTASVMARIKEPQKKKRDITISCGKSIIRQATKVAAFLPKITGKELMPKSLSPLVALKSFIVIIPCAPKAYNVSTIRTSLFGKEIVKIAAPVNHGSPS